MGWSYGWDSKKAIIAHLTREQHGEGRTWRKAAHCYRGNNYRGVLWSVSVVTLDATGEILIKFIECDLLECHNREWGYKDMDESMGPCYYSCPLAYLDMTPVPASQFAFGWRDKVRAYHALRTVKLEVGKTYPAIKGIKVCGYPVAEITVKSLRPMRGEARLSTGAVEPVRFKRTHIATTPEMAYTD